MAQTTEYLLFVLALALFVSGGCTRVSPEQNRLRLESFDYRGVTLDGGRLGRQYEEVRRDYLAISNDGLLKGFRQRAGLPAPGPDLGEWYQKGLFHIFGQVLSGLARFHAGTGDPACRDKANLLIHEWGRCIAPDGYFFNTPQAASPHYTYEKMVGGLVDNYVYCGNQEARDCLSRITDWAMKNLPRNPHPWCVEWFTLGENLYRAYLATGEEKYREFAKVWEYTDYWNRFTGVPNDIFANPPLEVGKPISFHAYSHVNTFCGAAATYEVTGDERYLQIIKNAHAWLQNTQTFATGGYGPLERLMPHDELIGSLDNPFIFKHFETQCGSWAAFKLSKYLIRFTGEAKYGDWVERLTLNGIGASLPMSDGRVMYDSDYHPGGARKVNTQDAWTCCAGTRSMAIADYADLACFHDRHNLYVNLFTPFTIQWSHEGRQVVLRQRTLFPEDNEIHLTVSVPRPDRFGLFIRKPQWLAGPAKALLNGQPAQLHANTAGWLGLKRQWRDGDRLTIVLPMTLEWDALDPQHAYPGAVRYGPVVLAVGSEGANPGDSVNPRNLSGSLVPVDGAPLHFRLAEAPLLVARPFYEFREGERYFMYLDPKWSNRISARDFTYDGKWVWGMSSEAGAWAECAFTGSTVGWMGHRSDDGGRAEVMIDGRVAATVDQFSQAPDSQISWEQTGLEPGRHTIRITILGEKHPESRGNAINIAGLRVDDPDSRSTLGGPSSP
ncbi:MAG: glycoside hydrolase family 127 protein [Phycisphaerae bacterium]|nr:glycoside hydrolase family 127 protein [Phycisphaerae bacterium]